MSHELLDVFGKALMENVRDTAIRDWDSIVLGHMKSTDAVEIYKELNSKLNQEQIEVLLRLIPQIVDSTIYQLLWALEQKNKVIKVSVTCQDDTIYDICAESDGLSGEIFTEDGWISRFSKERYYNGI